MHARTFARLLSVAVVASLAACGSDGPSAPGSRPSLDKAFLELNTPALSAGAGKPVTMPALVPSLGDGKRCAYAAASQSFTCPTQTFGDLTVGSSFTLLAANGSPQSAFDSTTTAAVRFDATAAGIIEEGPTKLTVEVKQSVTLSGLLTGTHVIDGTGTSKVSGTIAPASTPIPFTTTTNTTITHLVLLSCDDMVKWPLSGTITSESSTLVSGLPAVPSRVEVTFSGTSRVAVVITVAGVTKHCTVDLSMGAPSCG
jgi:hypothetical protein